MRIVGLDRAGRAPRLQAVPPSTYRPEGRMSARWVPLASMASFLGAAVVAGVLWELTGVLVAAGVALLSVAALLMVRLASAPRMPAIPGRPSTPARTAPESAPPAADEQPPDLRQLFAAAVAVRMLGAVLFNLTRFNRMVAPDSDGYAYYGKMIAYGWRNPAFEISQVVGYNPRSFYQHFNGLVYYVAGIDPSLLLSLLNAFVGSLAAWFISRLTFRLYGPEAARRAFILTAFFPSLVLWTSINLRDAWSLALLGGSLLAAQHLREAFSLRKLAILAACFAVMPFVRGYLVPVVGIGVLASYLVVRIRRLPAALASMAVMLGLMLYMADTFGVNISVDVEERLQEIERLRNGLAYGASAFDTSMSIATPAGALAYLPVGVANFLLSPFPWRIASWRQVLALPEALATYYILYCAAREMLRSMRLRLSDVAMVALAVAMITCAYGLVEGNEGTAYRHRAHALILFFVFAAGWQAPRSKPVVGELAPVDVGERQVGRIKVPVA